MNHNKIHVGIIMDGNGRWARRRGLPRPAGHAAGAKSARAVVEAAVESGRVDWLTLYAFSSDNWQRPAEEVDALMGLFHDYLGRETPRCVENGVRLRVVGRRDRLPRSLVDRIEASEAATGGGRRMTLRLAVDYSARDLIVKAAERGDPDLCRERFSELLGEAMGCGEPTKDVDLLIRTGGEQRLSDFMLWECAYAELYFTQVLWPDFGAAQLGEALADYGRRERRFGRVLREAG